MNENECNGCNGDGKCWPLNYPDIVKACPCKKCLVKGICITQCEEFYNLSSLYLDIMNNEYLSKIHSENNKHDQK